MVEVGAHSVTERAQQGKAIPQDVAACGKLISDRKEQLLLPTTAVEIVGARRLAHARVGERAVAIKVPVPLR